MAGADDPADSFEYDEHGCLVQLTPEAFDYFMLVAAPPARVAEALARLQRWPHRLLADSDDPYVEGQRAAILALAASIKERLQVPVTQLRLMRLMAGFDRAVQRFDEERDQERRVSRWVEF